MRILRLHARSRMVRYVPARGWRRLIAWLPYLRDSRALCLYDNAGNLFTHPKNVARVSAALHKDGWTVHVIPEMRRVK